LEKRLKKASLLTRFSDMSEKLPMQQGDTIAPMHLDTGVVSLLKDSSFFAAVFLEIYLCGILHCLNWSIFTDVTEAVSYL
jgi:hypothetical protein